MSILCTLNSAGNFALFGVNTHSEFILLNVELVEMEKILELVNWKM